MKRIKLNKKIVLRHTLSWIGVSFLSNFIVPPQLPYSLLILRLLLELFILIFTYYSVSIFISPYLKLNLKIFTVLIFSNYLLFITQFYLLEYGQSYILDNEPFEMPSLRWIAYSTLYYFMISLLAHSFYNNQMLIQTIETESQKKQEILKQSIANFKNKFSSTLNSKFLEFCYQKFENRDPNSKEAILIYKSMTEQTQKINAFETISIQQEINYLQDYLKLQQLVGKNVPVNFEYSIDNYEFHILPRLLINFIENAFKYSPSGDLNKPIQILISIKDNELDFNVHNYKINYTDQNLKSTNKGNIFVKNQLNLFYKKNYTLDVLENETTYSSHLKLRLK